MFFSPTFENLALLAPEGSFCGRYLCGNPRLYKYTWRIFWRGTPVEGMEFLKTESVSTKLAYELMATLEAKGEPYFVLNDRHPRRNSIWNVDSPRLKNVTFAPSYDEDADPPTDSGHR